MEESFNEYLGIQYDRDEKNKIHLTQKGLIMKIIDAVGLTNLQDKRDSSCNRMSWN